MTSRSSITCEDPDENWEPPITSTSAWFIAHRERLEKDSDRCCFQANLFQGLTWLHYKDSVHCNHCLKAVKLKHDCFQMIQLFASLDNSRHSKLRVLQLFGKA